MSIVDRATNISLRPQSEWPVIAAEPASVAGIFTGYIAPLAAIGPIALVIGLSIVGVGIPFLGTYRAPLGTSVTQAVLTFVMILIGVAIMSAIVSALAPSFGGRRDALAALKLVGYAYTPAFIAGILGLFPPISFLEIFAGLWTLYVFYKGAPPLFMSAPDKALAFTATCVVCGIALGFVGMLAGGAVAFATGGFGAHRPGIVNAGDAQGRAVVASVLGTAMGGGASNQKSAQQMVDAVATAGADAGNAQASGDANAQAQAGLNALNSIVRGGKTAVQPIAREQLKALLPDSAGGLARTSSEGSSGTFAGIAGSSANATYGTAGNGTIEIDVADLGNMGGIAAIASIGANLQIESQTDSGYEKNIDVDGRGVHEKWINDGKHSDLMEIVDNRYAIGVTGTGVDMDTALAALKSVDVAKFQSLGAAAH
jgi:Yip1 domain